MRACSKSFERVSCVRHWQRRAPLPGTTSSPVPKHIGHAADSTLFRRVGFTSETRDSSAASPSGTANRGGIFLRLPVGIRENFVYLLETARGGLEALARRPLRGKKISRLLLEIG